jgi:hypothetical protein
MSGQPAQQGSDQEVAEQIPALPWRVPLDPAPWWAWTLFVLPFIAMPILNSWLWMGARDMLAVGLLTIIGASVVRVAGGVVLYRVESRAGGRQTGTPLAAAPGSRRTPGAHLPDPRRRRFPDPLAPPLSYLL